MRKITAINLVTGVLLLAVIAVPIVYVGSWWWSSAEPSQPVVQSEAPASEIVEASGITEPALDAHYARLPIISKLVTQMQLLIGLVNLQSVASHFQQRGVPKYTAKTAAFVRFADQQDHLRLNTGEGFKMAVGMNVRILARCAARVTARKPQLTDQ